MDRNVTPPDDDFKIRCPRLGHQIYFSYCRVENRGRPCFKILDCWHTYFDVEEFLKSQLSREQWRELVTRRPEPKVMSLMELISQARRHAEKAEDK
ncbi:MAG TPA: hypothetical protein ENN79_08195 [Desulfobacteraceae bacterium]|nr:hypothetical protein [Desulfobacteraceae bacterium]